MKLSHNGKDPERDYQFREKRVSNNYKDPTTRLTSATARITAGVLRSYNNA